MSVVRSQPHIQPFKTAPICCLLVPWSDVQAQPSWFPCSGPREAAPSKPAGAVGSRETHPRLGSRRCRQNSFPCSCRTRNSLFLRGQKETVSELLGRPNLSSLIKHFYLEIIADLYVIVKTAKSTVFFTEFLGILIFSYVQFFLF